MFIVTSIGAYMATKWLAAGVGLSPAEDGGEKRPLPWWAVPFGVLVAFGAIIAAVVAWAKRSGIPFGKIAGRVAILALASLAILLPEPITTITGLVAVAGVLSTFFMSGEVAK